MMSEANDRVASDQQSRAGVNSYASAIGTFSAAIAHARAEPVRVETTASALVRQGLTAL